MSDPAVSASETNAEEEYSEVSDSVAYSLIEDLVRNKKVILKELPMTLFILLDISHRC